MRNFLLHAVPVHAEQRAVPVDLAQMVFDTVVDTMDLTVADAVDELRRRLKSRGLRSDNEAVCAALRSIDPSLGRAVRQVKETRH
jgi:hypothetical protein